MLAGRVVGYARRQVVDLPELRLLTTEHVAERQQCPACGHVTQGGFPAEAVGVVSYGPRLRGVAVYLSAYQLVPYARAQELLADLFGCSFSAGTLAAVVAACHATLAATAPALHAALQHAAVAHCDETGLRVAGQPQGLHVASTARLTHYGVQRQRGTAAMQALGVLPGFGGVAVHDGLAAYGTVGCQHALCNGHHLRELTFVAEQYHQGWAGECKALLQEMTAAVDAAREAGRSHLDPAAVRRYETRYRELALAGVAAHPPPEPRVPGQSGPPKRSPGGKLAERLGRHEAAALRFLHDFRVPFDNNQAERDLRMVTVQQKISGGFRTARGAAQFCRIRGYLSTARKQGHAPLTALQAACAGTPLVLTGAE